MVLSTVSSYSLEDVAEAAARRLPVLADLPVQSSWWGWYDVSPDWNALVGEALLKHFGSAKAVSRAGIADLQAVGGISAQMAKTIYDHFHERA